MISFPNSYKVLLNTVTDAAALIDEMNYGAAKETLVKGKHMAEKLYEGETKNEREFKEWMEEMGRKMAKDKGAEELDPRKVVKELETLDEGEPLEED